MRAPTHQRSCSDLRTSKRVRSRLQLSRCNVCSATIYWLFPKSTQPWAVDSAPLYILPGLGSVRVITLAGQVLRGQLCTASAEGAVMGYTNHDTNCAHTCNLKGGA